MKHAQRIASLFAVACAASVFAVAAVVAWNRHRLTQALLQGPVESVVVRDPLLLDDLLSSGDPLKKLRALQIVALADVEWPRHERMVLLTLNEPNPDVRRHAVRALEASYFRGRWAPTFEEAAQILGEGLLDTETSVSVLWVLRCIHRRNRQGWWAPTAAMTWKVLSLETEAPARQQMVFALLRSNDVPVLYLPLLLEEDDLAVADAACNIVYDMAMSGVISEDAERTAQDTRSSIALIRANLPSFLRKQMERGRPVLPEAIAREVIERACD
jgi:hypothetical protein